MSQRDLTPLHEFSIARRLPPVHYARSRRAPPAREIGELYGREIPRWSVYFQLLAHMNEHLGQSIAYARMNEIVPPWSN